MVEAADEHADGAPDKRSEAAALARMAEELTAELPHIPPQEIAVALRAEQERFVNSPIRDFIPILVERSVRRRFGLPAQQQAG
ncbi:MAG TPA: hypothetical protein VKB75_09345 [Jatrophihabitans sp.]|nr:hypothetical protein [Jatrophihabitans sp.]